MIDLTTIKRPDNMSAICLVRQAGRTLSEDDAKLTLFAVGAIDHMQFRYRKMPNIF